jgi:hypothetical protein
VAKTAGNSFQVKIFPKRNSWLSQFMHMKINLFDSVI